MPKLTLRGKESKVYILDFFGSPKLRGSWTIPPHRHLTAFGSPWNTFLGYFVEDRNNTPALFRQQTRQQRGIIWGKDPKHYQGRESMLMQVAKNVQLISTASKNPIKYSNINYVGHQSAEGWNNLLSTSKFLLGLGNPLLGPSAIDAIAMGCTYINPIYSKPLRNNDAFDSQHPYAAKLGPPYVCSYHENNVMELQSCIDLAMNSTLAPIVPRDFRKSVYLERVRQIFNL